MHMTTRRLLGRMTSLKPASAKMVWAADVQLAPGDPPAPRAWASGSPQETRPRRVLSGDAARQRVGNVNEIVDGHVVLDLECLDRIYLNAYVPKLQVSGQVVTFFSQHRNQRVASPALANE